MTLFPLDSKPLAAPRRERGDFAVRGLALIEEDVFSESDGLGWQDLALPRSR